MRMRNQRERKLLINFRFQRSTTIHKKCLTNINIENQEVYEGQIKCRYSDMSQIKQAEI